MNKIIKIGFRGVYSCYLNITKEDAIKRYRLEYDIPENEDIGANVEEFEFEDAFAAYDVYSIIEKQYK